MSASARSKSVSVLARATAALSREYLPESYYWEVVELCRRLVISALLAIPSSMTRLAAAQITCFLYAVLLFTVRPFKRVDDTVVLFAEWYEEEGQDGVIVRAESTDGLQFTEPKVPLTRVVVFCSLPHFFELWTVRPRLYLRRLYWEC